MSGSARFSSSDWGRALMAPKRRMSEVAIDDFIVLLLGICLAKDGGLNDLLGLLVGWLHLLSEHSVSL